MNFEVLLCALASIPLIALGAIALESATAYTQRWPWLQRRHGIILKVSKVFSGLTLLLLSSVAIGLAFGGWGPWSG
ncbi:MAG: hypothetical protein PW845_20995 [Pseudomonas sp.]|uniref:hypothetical protein n=1 Tax=Pseudomonas abieticivorans TaxID=2931382 RepID=UPI0020C08363|nr:hypothetical protein [Pseudomonas sp. PIA16]MDE1167781.1 hypothetical protein [Pseudomonas sp.]